ncbi:MAG: hypothetical protein JWP19_1074 [Rhodoglobus sp.]|jgi:hypothetical protein|nr:hypothetical protein [Rhodoglobus sp.]
MPPAGWYPDLLHAAQVRWWNGTAWTEHVELVKHGSAPQGIAINRLRDEPLVTSIEVLRAAAGFQ